MDWRIFLVSSIMSLGRTVSALFTLKVRFTIFFFDPPSGWGQSNAFSGELISDCDIPFYAGDMRAWRAGNENLLKWNLKNCWHFFHKIEFFSSLTPHVKNIFSKIPRLRQKGAVFTVGRPEHGANLRFLDRLPAMNGFWDVTRNRQIFGFFCEKKISTFAHNFLNWHFRMTVYFFSDVPC